MIEFFPFLPEKKSIASNLAYRHILESIIFTQSDRWTLHISMRDMLIAAAWNKLIGQAVFQPMGRQSDRISIYLNHTYYSVVCYNMFSSSFQDWNCYIAAKYPFWWKH